MKSLFIQTAEYNIANTTYSICLNDIPKLIRKNTDWDYACTQTETGYYLKPTFHNMPYRNSFVPEVDIVVSHNGAQTILSMSGRPVKLVRVFMAIWFGFALIIEILLLALAFTSNLDTFFPVFIPIIMFVFGYLLCKIATRATFKSVIKAIQKEL